jgi:hypothetical protein
MSDYQAKSPRVGATASSQSPAIPSAAPGKQTLVQSLPSVGPGQAGVNGAETAGDIRGSAGGSSAKLERPPVDVEAMKAGGRSLDPKVQAQLEQRFGQSLADVRIHTEPQAAAQVERMGAAAYTHQNHIAFATGRYQPDTPEGMALLAHELTHVVQGGGATGGGKEARPGDPAGGHEAEANRVATTAASDSHLMGGGPAPGASATAALPTQEASAAAAGKLGQPAPGWEVSQRADPDRAHRCIGGGTPAPARPPLATIMADGTVSAALVQAWNDSNPNAPEVPSGTPGSTKVEQGGWIIWNPTANTFTVQRVPHGTRDGLAPIVGTKPADTASAIVVAWFHTHPNTRAEGYGPDPSGGDTGFTQSAQVPGIIKTHEGDKTIPYP